VAETLIKPRLEHSNELDDLETRRREMEGEEYLRSLEVQMDEKKKRKELERLKDLEEDIRLEHKVRRD
jgi:hypothetical protein